MRDRFPPSWLRLTLLTANLLAPCGVIGSGFAAPFVVGAVIVHALLFYGIVAPNSQLLGPLVKTFATTAREVWLTIDDGPSGEETLTLAEELRRRHVPATFFVIGRKVAVNADVLPKIEALGHSVANHTQTHPAGMFWGLLRGQLRREIDACNSALAAAATAPRRWFRAPVGLKHIFLAPLLAERGMRLIGWSARGRDGVSSPPQPVIDRILAAVKPGAIIVLHEGRPRNIETILRVVEELQQRGFTFVVPTDEQLR